MAYRPDVSETLDRYARAWTTDDPDDRWALVHAATAPTVVYLGADSDRPVEGQAALAAYLGLPRPPGRVEVGEPQLVHGRLSAPWRRVTAEGDARGVLFARLDGQNRLEEIVHFSD